ncbi:hypothetical protein X474_10370 [Dethiosulfatarculus sandiegensis]|uniref:Uncharacterized protein n=1 Tax=Dethiosulfatarculus sandiegensis TaxID=1429043 RepID=A0A0D2GI08_9BACT|nr:hypothetical protein X474_10370 [Dethiosulfatarculus sandiegensis]
MHPPSFSANSTLTTCPTFGDHLFSKELGGARIFLKREDLTHTGAHKINNALGLNQALKTK